MWIIVNKYRNPIPQFGQFVNRNNALAVLRKATERHSLAGYRVQELSGAADTHSAAEETSVSEASSVSE